MTAFACLRRGPRAAARRMPGEMRAGGASLLVRPYLADICKKPSALPCIDPAAYSAPTSLVREEHDVWGRSHAAAWWPRITSSSAPLTAVHLGINTKRGIGRALSQGDAADLLSPSLIVLMMVARCEEAR